MPAIVVKSIVLAAKMWIALGSGGFSMPTCEDEISKIGASPVILVYESLRLGEDPRIIFSIAHNESTMRWWAISRTNRIGLLQITPRYHCRPETFITRFSDLPCMTVSSRTVRGIQVWQKAYSTFGNEFDALRAYNAGRRGAQNPKNAVGYANSVSRRIRLLRAEVEI
jgi:soluble lytic murein transglycosylase-like protein